MSDGSDYLFGRFDASLKAVIVGEQCPPWQWPGVLDVCDQLGATAYHLHWLHEGPHPVELEKDLADRADHATEGVPTPPPASPTPETTV